LGAGCSPRALRGSCTRSSGGTGISSISYIKIMSNINIYIYEYKNSDVKEVIPEGGEGKCQESRAQ